VTQTVYVQIPNRHESTE